MQNFGRTFEGVVACNSFENPRFIFLWVYAENTPVRWIGRVFCGNCVI